MNDLDELVRATVKIVGKTTGTGFFVAPGYVVTCEHVAGDIGEVVAVHCYAAVARPIPGAANHTLVPRQGTVVDVEKVADVALIKVTPEGSADRWPTLRLADAVQTTHRTWDGYGFPEDIGAGTRTSGDVRLVDAVDRRGRAALQLYSIDAGAGRGAALDGYSGSAVLSLGRVIGQLRSTPKDDEGLTKRGSCSPRPRGTSRGC
jgi:S1-C subfamily serine protease